VCAQGWAWVSVCGESRPWFLYFSIAIALWNLCRIRYSIDIFAYFDDDNRVILIV